MEEKNKRTLLTFQTKIADASLSHLIELSLALRAYKEGIVLVGGWVPYLLLSQFQRKGTDFQHIGSKDIDLALNPKIIDEQEYAGIRELITARGYRPKEGSTFSFIKQVKTVDGKEDFIQVDFLGPEYGEAKESQRHQRVQDEFLLRKARGVDVVFDHTLNFELIGKLPNGAEGKAVIKIADIVGIVALKGIVLGSRYKEKDAYDLFSLIAYYKEGPEAVAREMKPFLDNKLIIEGIDSIREKFRSREAEGPAWVADFLNEEGESREQRVTDAYMQAKRFIEDLIK